MITEGSADSRAAQSLNVVHPARVASAREIRALLERARKEGVRFRRGLNRRIDPEHAEIERIADSTIVLRTSNFEPGQRDLVFLNFLLDGRPYFFSSRFERELGKGRIVIGIPDALYCSERRARTRVEHARRRHVTLHSDGESVDAEVVDSSPQGLGVSIAGSCRIDKYVRVAFRDGPQAGLEAFGEVRSFEAGAGGWARLGLDLSSAPIGAPLHVESRDAIVPTSFLQRTQRRWRVLGAAARSVADRALGTMGMGSKVPSVRIVDYANHHGENIRAIVDFWGETPGATAVVIPPAWGRTKETLMPLAATIVATFRASHEPIVVLRFDGIRRRGESHNDPECSASGAEHHNFTFSQAVGDIRATVDFLERDPKFRPKKTIVVSFSAASIEARRAVATDSRLSGWVSVVGAAELQATMRSVSGGIDYVLGSERGARFGIQEILGFQIDMDRAAADGARHNLLHLEDSRRDMAQIKTPVTWIHGRYDAWMDAGRARDSLSRGDTSRRRFIEVPTGHLLRSSKEALETFQLVATEVGRMALGRELEPTLPDLSALERQSRAERGRLRLAPLDLRRFWRDYVVGHDGKLGIELMTRISAYRELMESQVAALQVKPGQTVVDLGCGTGAFPLRLSGDLARVDARIVGVDFVREGLERARALVRDASSPRPVVEFVEADLNAGDDRARFPIASASCDGILASLFLSYVEDTPSVLAEMRRILRPGGRLVVSTLRRDADVSRIFLRGLDELRSADADTVRGLNKAQIDEGARDFLNQASKLLDLEENGTFRFWDANEFTSLVADAGFDVLTVEPVFGNPPQAVVLAATRR
jgi:ubiquinone/menaquinone biosynthesis C-methylase UbiE